MIRKTKRNIGIWIDSRKAVIVTLEGNANSQETVESRIKGHPHFSGGSRTRDNVQSIVSEQKYNRRFEQRLKHYFEKVAEKADRADSIYLIGPGEAKVHLRDFLIHEKDADSVPIVMETADAMTNRQFVARVERFFDPRLKTASAKTMA